MHRHPNRPLPRLWLMTDERQGDSLWTALDRLPRGAGVIVRHYSLPASERRVLFARIRRRTAGRGIALLLAGSVREAITVRADGVHGARHNVPGRMIHSRAAHDGREIVAAARAAADLVFVSPVFPTRSHPGARTLGRARLGLMIRDSRVPVIALGGVTQTRARGLAALGVHGWAGIDAWAPAIRT